MEQKSLGVIGGMGPKATAVFFDKVIEHTVAERDQDHVNMIILNHASLPDRTDVILSGNGEHFLKAVAGDLRLLEHAGAAHIAIPCNTSHYFYNEMQKLTSIPIIHMIKETFQLISTKFGAGSKIGILATSGTINSGIYAEECNKHHMEMHIPDDSIQERVMKIIYTDVKGNMNFDPTELESLIHELIYEHGCHCVILACTELSCIKLGPHATECSVDAMQVLVEKAITLSGKSIKPMNS